MSENILPFLLQCIGVLLSALITVLICFGRGIINRLGEISENLTALTDRFSLDIAKLDNRLTRVETRCEIHKHEEAV